MNYKIEADKIVEMFMPYCDSDVAYDNDSVLKFMKDAERKNAIQCAIKAVEMQIKVAPSNDFFNTMDNLKLILNELKQM